MLEVKFSDGSDLECYERHYVQLMENAFAQPLPNGVNAFRLKHLANPFGRSYGGFVFDQDVLVGMNLFWKWEFARHETVIPAVQSCDTAVHSAFRGKALFTRIQTHCMDRMPTGIIRFGFPNENSTPGFKRLGWNFPSNYVKSIYVRHAGDFLRKRVIGRKSAGHSIPQSNELTDVSDAEIDAFLLAVQQEGSLFKTRYSAEFLHWRAAMSATFSWAVLRHGGKITAIVIYSESSMAADPGYRTFSIADIIHSPSARLTTLRRSLNDFLRVNNVAEIQNTTTRADWILNLLGLCVYRRANALILHPAFGWTPDLTLDGFLRNSALTTADTDHFL